MTTEYAAIVAYIVAAVKATWGGNVNVDLPEVPHPALPYTVVAMAGAAISNETPVSDQIEFAWDVVGTFARTTGSIDSLVIAKAHALRIALLASKNPGTHGFMPMVTSFSRLEGDELDDRVHVSVRFECRASVARI